MINSGWGYDAKAKKMTYDPSRNDGLEDDARTFGILRDIANSLDQDIQMTVDIPSDFPDRQLPDLDLAIFVRDNQVHHSFYQKPMATWVVLKDVHKLANDHKWPTVLSWKYIGISL